MTVIDHSPTTLSLNILIPLVEYQFSTLRFDNLWVYIFSHLIDVILEQINYTTMKTPDHIYPINTFTIIYFPLGMSNSRQASGER